MSTRRDTTNGQSIPQDRSSSVEALVSQALTVVKQTQSRHPSSDSVESYDTMVSRLVEAVLSDDPLARRRAINGFVKAGVHPAEIVLNYAADAARQLGKSWANNELSFVDVTIGTARLQETVRQIGGRRAFFANESTAPRVLVIVPENEDHTMGAFIAIQEFERYGAVTHLSIAQKASEVAQIANRQHFDLVGFSVSSPRSVLAARQLITNFKNTKFSRPKFVIGGSVTDDTAHHAEVLEETGADHITCDIKEALRLTHIDAHQRQVIRQQS